MIMQPNKVYNFAAGGGGGAHGGKDRGGRGGAQANSHAGGAAVAGAGAGGAAGAGDTEASGWYYRDPKGQIHGPWKAGDIAKWFRAGFYGRDLPVRKGSSGEWTTLAQAMPYVTGDDADSKGGGGSRKQGKGGKGKDGHASKQGAKAAGNGGGGAAGGAVGGGGAGGAGAAGGNGGSGNGGASGGRGGKKGRGGCGGGDVVLGGAINLKAEADPSRGLVRTDLVIGGGQGGGNGKGAGRKGGKKGGGGPAPSAEAVVAAAASLFNASKEWRYLDDSGKTQGPFEALKMCQWHAAGYFHDQLQVAAVSEGDAEPDYKPLGELIRTALQAQT